MNFENWLKKHKKEQNAIGDLARDFIASKEPTIELSFSKFPTFLDAQDTYHHARRSYVLELANTLHEELSKILDDEVVPSCHRDQALYALHNLQDYLVDIDIYLDIHHE